MINQFAKACSFGVLVNRENCPVNYGFKTLIHTSSLYSITKFVFHNLFCSKDLNLSIKTILKIIYFSKIVIDYMLA